MQLRQTLLHINLIVKGNPPINRKILPDVESFKYSTNLSEGQI
jgi:hypothetical protein